MQMFNNVAVVVGGGIAGLTAAASLLRQGWRVTVVEQAPAFTEVGAGLGVTANGLSALDSLDLDTATRSAGHLVHMAGTMDDRGNWLMHIPRSAAAASPQDVYGIHRQALHQLLLGAASAAHLVTGARAISVDEGDPASARAVVRCTSNQRDEQFEADLVVAADGLRSGVRSQFAPATVPVYSGKSSWRGIVDDSALVSNDFIVRWGTGTEFGAVRISEDQVYWYGYTHSPEGHRWPDEKEAARQHFSNWAEPVRALIDKTSADRLMRHDVYSLAPKLQTYVYGRIVLIGDAAHAMVPTMGQGANSSLEDGVCIGEVARLVNTGMPLAAALRQFDSIRRPRTQLIARRSAEAGRLGADLRGRFAIAARNMTMKCVPAGLMAAAGTAVLSWEAPAVTR